MKKSALLALACAAFTAVAASAQVAPEVKYVEDPNQGYTFNRFKDNWFITAEGGVNVIMGKTDKATDFGKRIAPAAGLQIGKWFSPVMGFRGGFTWLGQKGASNTADAYGLVGQEGGGLATFDKNGHTYYKTNINQMGVNFDAMLNVTNWLCGYKPNRVYNFIAYVGGATYFGLEHKLKADLSNDGWDTDHFDTSLALRGGIINSFNISKQVALSLDIRYTAMSANRERMAYNRITNNLAALIGVTYNFNKRTWTAPIVPVVDLTDYQNKLDQLQADVNAANADANAAKRKLNDCLNQLNRAKSDAAKATNASASAPANGCATVATVYFPIGSSSVSRTDRNVLRSVANVMKSDTDVKYNVCGWADNYTGTDAVNQRLRENRAKSVKNILVNNGVNSRQLNVTTDSRNFIDGRENIYLDRCVTIDRAN